VNAQYDREATAACRPPATAPPPSAPPPSAPPLRIELALDGGWVRSWDNAHGMEIKVGVVHTGSERCGATRTRLMQRRYAATTAGVTPFGARVTAALAAVDGFAAADQTLLGDGAAWIWRLGAELLPTATQVLDRCGCPLGSMRDVRRRATRAAIPDKAIRPPWSMRLEEAVDRSAVANALGVRTEVMQQYPHPALGSGAVEKGVDVVVNRRLKGRRGMRWWRERASGVIALRLAILNDEWEQRVRDAHAA
jgi:hypothetical protein